MRFIELNLSPLVGSLARIILDTTLIEFRVEGKSGAGVYTACASAAALLRVPLSLFASPTGLRGNSVIMRPTWNYPKLE